MVSFLNLCGVDVPLPPFCVATPSGLKAEGKTFPPAFNNCDGTDEQHDTSAISSLSARSRGSYWYENAERRELTFSILEVTASICS
jgi:hypothetical protein